MVYANDVNYNQISLRKWLRDAKVVLATKLIFLGEKNDADIFRYILRLDKKNVFGKFHNCKVYIPNIHYL